MKKHYVMLLFSLIVLAGCASQNTRSTVVNNNVLKESWVQKINTNPNKWKQHADYWFLTGEPNQIERYGQKAPSNEAITVSRIKVNSFTALEVEGPFQVQISGHQDKNSVYILGPNAQTRHIAVISSPGKIIVKQMDTCGTSTTDPCLTDKVIVRIGMQNLNKLTHRGTGLVQGRDISSHGLTINATSSGTVMLDGAMPLVKVNQFGTGSITVFGAETPTLDINVKGNGNVNVAGRVGVHHIAHDGDGEVNIIGADTNALNINTSCNGLTTVVGYSNLKQVSAIGKSRVYVYWVNSNGTQVFLKGQARVGLAGATQNLNVETMDAGCFLGKYLRSNNVYVKTQNASHANVNADQKLFAVALHRSSIYFMGTPKIISRHVENDGVILPVWDEEISLPKPMPYARSYKQ